MVDEKKSTDTNAECTAPEWINAELIQKALHNSGEKDLQVKSVSVSVATAPGDNYASTIYRVKAALTDGGERSVIVKGPAPGEATVEMIKTMGIFARETIMLAEVVPQIEAILEEAAPGKFPPFAARCPHHGSDPVEFLVLEDLGPAGFKVADRKVGLDFRHSLLAVRTLARFHAASHVLLRRRPELVDKLPNVFKQDNPAVENYFLTGIQATVDVCRSWPGYAQYAISLEKYKSVAMSTLKNVGDLKPGDFNAIGHGDCWVNNMMFRYEEGDPEPRGYRMVDFQGSFVTSPTLDLLYFLSTSVSEHVSANYQDDLIQEYCNTLKRTLALLGLQAPSQEALLADMDARGIFALFGTLNVIPIVRAQQPPDANAFAEGDVSAVVSLYEDPVVQNWMKRVLPEYKRKGWLPS